MSQTRTPRSGSAERLEAGRDEPGWRDRLNQHPLAPYHLILGAAMLLLILGLVMVLSSSSVESYEIHDSAFTLFSRQAIFAVIGVVAMLVISRLPISLFRRFALVFLVLSIVLLLLTFVPGVGTGVYGQRNWIRLFGPFRLQPSEFAKLALI
ncbi:MAG TPA: FtsW/RodA/SpoVE family cell cycle protein, partial [Candidatus Limnocylindrales bacterium]|nr:FtsW/RodA/SpoVE family cell cycle protein [Candidatus Limnocylindrales bacterium]